MKVFARLLLIFIGLVLVLSFAWTWFSLSWSYADGERAGYVQKFSNRGWICKTWEGEIAMVTMPGAIPEKFEFTVREESVVQQINALAGKRVVLHYRQHKFVPTTCFGETEYFVDGAREVQENLSPAPLAPPVSQQGQLSTPR